jgi:NADP-dependent 3-hydroxy acid dehydrogenase YdfG
VRRAGWGDRQDAADRLDPIASAQHFIEEGAFVDIFGRRQEKLDAPEATLGANASAVAGSVTHGGDLDRLFDIVKQERGTRDILVANAGTGALDYPRAL